MTDQPMQLGPNHHQMDAPSDVTAWTTIKTTRNVVSDDGRGMTLRDEWWDVPSFVVDTLAALPPAPHDCATSIRLNQGMADEIERLREAVETEWYNGNMDEGTRDRILAALPPAPPLDVEWLMVRRAWAESVVALLAIGTFAGPTARQHAAHIGDRFRAALEADHATD